jgi:ribosomal-protein-alanine N-acetyltransferase
MITVPILTTERLRLEPLSRRHSDGMFLLWSSVEVCRHSGQAVDWDGNPIRLPAAQRADSDKIIEFFENMATADRGFRWALLMGDSQEFAGAVGFNSLEPTVELAYHLRPEFWGRGLAREAAEAAFAWVNAETDGAPIEAFIEPGNVLSAALARRLGLAATGVLRDGFERYLLSRLPSPGT